MNPVAVFILSDVRSGSTLLDQCLGAHPQVVSLGEVHWLAAYITEDRSIYDPEHPLVCSCRARVVECPFWLAVAGRLGRPLDSLELRSGLKPSRNKRAGRTVTARAALRFVRAFPWLFRFKAVRRAFGSAELARDLASLYRAVADVTGRMYCVDSSKSPLRFKAMYDLDPAHSRAIVLTRDYRAVVHSKMKRGLSLDVAALGWKRKMLEIDIHTRGLPSTTVHFVDYETLCENPRGTLSGICSFLGIHFLEEMLARPQTEMHHIGGSPSKFDATRAGIVLDRSYEDKFNAAERARLRALVGNAASKWGY